MSNYVEHAKLEFEQIGYIPLDQEQEDGPSKWVQENVIELLEVLSKQGHSGCSIHRCVEYFTKLALFKPLSPIQCSDNEWCEVSDNVFQNKRLSSVFKEKKGLPYYLHAIVWKDQHGYTFTGSVIDSNGNDIASRQFIKVPFTPKTFYIDVIEDDCGIYVKDDSQLYDVFEYYRSV